MTGSNLTVLGKYCTTERACLKLHIESQQFFNLPHSFKYQIRLYIMLPWKTI